MGSPSSERLKIGLGKALNNLNPFGPALKGLKPDDLWRFFPTYISLWSGRPRQNLPKIHTGTSCWSTNMSMEAPLLGGFQYKYCHGYFLIKTNSVLLVCFPKITMQSGWSKKSECIKPPGVESVNPQPLYSSPTASRPYRGSAWTQQTGMCNSTFQVSLPPQMVRAWFAGEGRERITSLLSLQTLTKGNLTV